MVVVVAAIIRQGGLLLITQRHSHSHLGDLWEFPGGKVEAGETLREALGREIREELGVTIDVHEEFLVVEHHYPGRAVRLHFFNCSIVAGEPQKLAVADLRWIKPTDLSSFAFPEADAELIQHLKNVDPGV
jgi:mutator protein MutT